MEEAMAQVVSVVLQDCTKWMNENIHWFTLQPNCYCFGTYNLSAMHLAIGTEFWRVRGTTFDTLDVIPENERVRNDCTSVEIEEVMKSMGAKKRMCNAAEALMFMPEERAPPTRKGRARRSDLHDTKRVSWAASHVDGMNTTNLSTIKRRSNTK